jgi:hypothetical protein
VPNVFFVTQGKTYWFEERDGYIWAPKVLCGDRVYWRNVELVKAGDVIIHFAGSLNSGINAISQAKTNYYNSPITPELQEIAIRNEKSGVGFSYPNGRRVDCSYVILSNKMPIEDFHEVIIRFKRGAGKHSAFNKNGGVNQGYLYKLETPIARSMIKRAISLNPYLEKYEFITEILKILERN